MKDETKITVRVTSRQREQIAEAAKESRMTVSDYIRTVVYRQMGKGKV